MSWNIDQKEAEECYRERAELLNKLSVQHLITSLLLSIIAMLLFTLAIYV